MTNVKLQNPHDKFFKESFGDVAVAKDFLIHYFPPEVLQVLDLETLEPQKDSFITPELEENFSDLLFKVDICDCEGYLYLLFEHKSYRDKGTILQLLKYMVEIWEAKRNKERAKELPIIIPLVLYHGQKQWQLPKSLGEQLEGYGQLPQSVKVYVPDFEYLLYDLSAYEDEEIRGSVHNRIIYSLLRDVQIKRGETLIIAILRAFHYLDELQDKQSAVGYIETMLRYISEGGKDLTKEDMGRMIERLENNELKGSELVMTLAEIWKNEGVQQGYQQGRQEGMQQGRQEGMQQGMQALSHLALTQLTQKCGELPKELQQAIKQADMETLNSIMSNIFTIANLDEVKKYMLGKMN